VENALLGGLASLLATAGVGHYHPINTYPSGVVGIFTAPAPASHPQAITLTSYPVADSVDPDSTVGIQLRFRSTTQAGCNDLADAAFAVLHSRWGLTVGGVYVAQLFRRSSAALGPNGEGLTERTDNYYADVHHPTIHRF